MKSKCIHLLCYNLTFALGLKLVEDWIIFSHLFCCVVISGLRRLKEALEEIEEKHGCPSSSSIKGAIEKSRHSAKEDSADSDNSVFVNSTPSPRSKSSDLRKENDSPFPHMDSFATEERKPADSLDSLIGTLRHQIQSSDWLQKNSPELTAGEDPEILDVFKALLHSAAARK